ncbi:MAG TPA: hypothetical protein VMQ17_16375 [Candidatus Sulfotelmatobacter sp.]|jgi:hypothetical protein|nr:hypothetical protein [Candidatus Sulfotelmatobacter sp.]
MTGKVPVVQVLTELKGHNLLEDRSFSTIAEPLATQATVNAESVLSAAAIGMAARHQGVALPAAGCWNAGANYTEL